MHSYIARALISLFLLLSLPAAAWLHADTSSIRLVRSTSGGKGSLEGNRYVIQDPRDTFYAGRDRQVVVLFEWDTRPAAHAGKASWKDPTGSVVLITPFDYKMTSARFSIYWTLTLPDEPRLGLWAVEAEVDGQPAGVHTFRVEDAAVEGGAAQRPARRLHSPAETYAKAQAATLLIETFDARGARLTIGSGFAIDRAHVLTAFQVVEGASRVRIVPSSGEPVETDELAAWSGRQDWAVLRVPTLSAAPFPISPTRSATVGERCSFLDIGLEGQRVMVDVTIVGAQEFPQAGPRLTLSAPLGARTLGGALLNEYGEALAVLGGALMPGLGASTRAGVVSVPLRMLVSTMAVPLSALPSAFSEPGTKLSELLARGVFAPALVGARDVLTGTIALDVELRERGPIQVDERTEFHRKEGEATAILTFAPQKKREGLSVFRVYDIDNRLLLSGKPSKVSLKPHEQRVMKWKFPLTPLQPGLHRIDLYIGDDPIWRSYFRIVE